MDASKLAALLGRPLTPIETTNKDLYLKIARESLDDLLCTNLCDSSDPRIFDAREGYTTVYTDIFTELTEVKVNDSVIDAEKYSPRQWDKRSGSWYNSIVFTYKLCKGDEVEVSADWGFDTMPSDLQSVLAGLFGLVTKKNKFDGSVTSKQVEDFRISFDTDANLDAEFYATHNKTISKYSVCDIGYVRHGKIC